MERPTIDTPCGSCGHPYVRHTKAQEDDTMANYRTHLGCRECKCVEFKMPND